ncbi:hypothetical protein HGE1_02997 [Anaplasma phagocytophilum str. HGE1]|nr:hypothetical protein YYU_03235 [Anaplasma phagocytophilum str. HZ2]AGR81930.1 hypothetical protein YYY_03225 [Anaplasma phagocytophilum str. Dog2]EOA60991.1 hypothetical protein HGE1_02997 [Anaplasma phagocytophilum str. HGE1]
METQKNNSFHICKTRSSYNSVKQEVLTMKRIAGKGIQDQEVGNNASELNYVTKQVVKLYECCVPMDFCYLNAVCIF